MRSKAKYYVQKYLHAHYVPRLKRWCMVDPKNVKRPVLATFYDTLWNDGSAMIVLPNYIGLAIKVSPEQIKMLGTVFDAFGAEAFREMAKGLQNNSRAV